ncbi:hypothetical protein V7O66_11420 [Methanolobus sp. ZRKC3]|uniref:DUF7490 domain-containing protein n=1 Tax=Methanolobus sp. ZRKC3 TaxID=3125786 RepID=UPI00324A18A5
MRKYSKILTDLLLILLIVSVSMATGGCLRDFESQSNYRITDMEISADNIKSSYVDFSITSYVDNMGGDSKENTTLMLKAFSRDTGLLELSQEEQVGIIDKDSTAIIEQTIRLPKKGSYRIEATLFEGDKRKSFSQVTLYDLDNLATDLEEVGIEIDGIDFIVKKVTNSGVVIENDIYLKNEGADTSSNYKMLVKAREMDARLIADKKWTSTGKIEPEATVIKNVNLTVPDNYNYVVEVVIWDGDTVVKKGEDYVQLDPERTIDRGQKVEKKQIRTDDFVTDMVYEEAPMEEYAGDEAAPGFGLLTALVATMFAIFLARRGKND